MKTGYGFTEFENLAEFKSWLKKQKVTRKVTRLQVHHMWMPDYSCWAKDNALRRQHNTKEFHVNTNHWDTIAQHFSVFPNGHIVTGRSLNKTPIGIRGWNTNAICVEIYGNFDKGKDKMKDAQKKAVIGLYGELCKKFDLTPSVSTVRPHCWFTAGGTYLGDYSPSRSAKTCPGTNFMGIGNTKKAFNAKFYPMIKEYMKNGKPSNGDKSDDKEEDTLPTGIYKVTLKDYPDDDTLSIREGASSSYDKVGEVKKGDSYTIVEVEGNWGKLKSGAGWTCITERFCTKIK